MKQGDTEPKNDTPELETMPLLQGLNATEAEKLREQLDVVDLKQDEVLFESGDPADALYFFVTGEVTLYQNSEETHRLNPPALIGELGAAADVARNCRAVASEATRVFRLDSETFREFIRSEPKIGIALQRNMICSAADRIVRDQTRLSDMRRNLIRTQKAMKRMRDFLLESQDTVVSKPLHEILEGLIQQNRRVNYRVEPPASLSVVAHIADRKNVPVVEISRTHLSLRISDGALPAADTRISGVISLAGPEIPISGRVLRQVNRRIDLHLDLLIDEYVAVLEGYLTRVQMLDFLV